MYVYMFEVLHNRWNIDLILRLQKKCSEKNITLNDIQKKKQKKKTKIKTKTKQLLIQ